MIPSVGYGANPAHAAYVSFYAATQILKTEGASPQASLTRNAAYVVMGAGLDQAFFEGKINGPKLAEANFKIGSIVDRLV